MGISLKHTRVGTHPGHTTITIMNYVVGRLLVKEIRLSSEPLTHGSGETMFTAVKNSPFIVNLVLDTSVTYNSLGDDSVPPSGHPLTLSNVNIDAQLLYDNEEEKEVDFVKHKPMEYKVTIGEKGLEATFEIKLKVLTSQLEDMLFRVRFRALDVLQGKEICQHMIATSGPIKVISKPERTNKRPRAQGRKKNTNDEILGTLEDIQKRQQRQFQLLQQLLQEANSSGGRAGGASTTSSLSGLPGASPAPIPSPSGSLGLLSPSLASGRGSSSMPGTGFTAYQGIMAPFATSDNSQSTQSSFFSSLSMNPSKKQKIDADRPLDFETSFNDMLKAFESLSAETRPRLMENFVQTHRITVEQLTELHDMLSQGALDRTIGRSIQQPLGVDWMDSENTHECRCENCPFKREIEQRQDFMNDLTSWFHS